MLSLGLAQINPIVGDLDYNLALIRRYLEAAQKAQVQLLLFPELAICGYPPEDLLLRRGFLTDCERALTQLADAVSGVVVVVGFPQLRERNPYNAAAVLADGKVSGIYHKCQLPNYGVFDEDRYFARGENPALIRVADILCGLTVCEDIWYASQPLADEALAGAELILNISASPYYAGKGAERLEMLAQRARDHLTAVAYCNLVGGQDELLFDGQSMVLDHHGRLLARAQQFQEQLLLCAVDTSPVAGARLHDTRNRHRRPRQSPPLLGVFAGAGAHPSPANTVADTLAPLEEIYAALCLGMRDYTKKNGFAHALLGLSGGVDSALVALVAADALGAENVTAVVMPSPFSAAATQEDARTLAANLGVDLREIPITEIVAAYATALEGEFAGLASGVAEENIQARIRGNLLMALSNKFGWLLLSTGNKSEMAVGYSTLYGDLCGGLAVIKDVPKTLVFALTRWRNLQGSPVPESVLTRPPSAELAPGQQDTDSLPPYELLDPILERYIEDDESLADIVAAGFEAVTVERVAALVTGAEYKRRQAPPGIKVTTRAFGRDRRMPITNHYGAAKLH